MWPSSELENVHKPISDLSEWYASEMWSEAGVSEEHTYKDRGLKRLVVGLEEIGEDFFGV